MKICYECENCGNVSSKESAIGKCSVCSNDICEFCDDHVYCVVSRKQGHEDCYVQEDGEFYDPETHEGKACKTCSLIFCDCEKKNDPV